MPEETVLHEAARLVDGDRQADYGAPLTNHGRTAELWNAYLRASGQRELDAVDVCHLNILQKMSRTLHRRTRDSFVDQAGYAANAWMVEAERRRLEELGE